MLPLLREAEVARARGAGLFPFQVQLPSQVPGQSEASSGGAGMPGWSCGWPEQPKVISIRSAQRAPFPPARSRFLLCLYPAPLTLAHQGAAGNAECRQRDTAPPSGNLPSSQG